MKHGSTGGRRFPRPVEGHGRTWKLKSCGVGKMQATSSEKSCSSVFFVMLLKMISLYINDSCKGNPKRDFIFYSFWWGDVMTTLGVKTHEATGRPLLDLRPGDEPFTHPFFSAGKKP